MIQSDIAIRLARNEAGITQRELARRARTSPATLSRYESGQLVPNVRTLNRILACCLSRRRRWSSLSELAPVFARTRTAVADGAQAWRLVGEVLDDEAEATAADTALVVADPPSPTGDGTTDAVLAGLAEYICLRRGIPAPPWALDEARVARPWWFPAGSRPWIPTALRESPRSFAKRGVFVTAPSMVRV